MGRLIDVDDLCSWLGFEDTQEERDNNYAENITLEEIDRIETVNVEEREEVKKLIRAAKKRSIDNFYKRLRTEFNYVSIIAKDMKEDIDKCYESGEV